MKIEKKKKIKKIFLNCIYAIITICIMYNIIFLINTNITKKNYMTILGITFFNMENDLMKDDISKNDFVIVKKVKEKNLQQGDIIAYTVNGQIRINKIINIKNGYTTKSNKNYYPDIEKISFDNIVGEKVVTIPFLGLIIEILQSEVTSIFVFLFLLLSFGYNKYMYIKKKERAQKKRKLEEKV